MIKLCQIITDQKRNNHILLYAGQPFAHDIINKII